MCGENAQDFRSLSYELGSPPRVRGKPDELIKSADKGRITPACAGKTKITIRVLTIGWDHPRVCGENIQVLYNTVSGSGSPPRVRGKLKSSKKKVDYVRITPACAGKTKPRHW